MCVNPLIPPLRTHLHRHTLNTCKYRQLRAREINAEHSKMFCSEPEGHYHCTKSKAIAPIWFSMEHRGTALMPFWFSADDIVNLWVHVHVSYKV